MTYEIYKNYRTDSNYKRVEDNAKIKNICDITWEDSLEKSFINFSFSTTDKLECGQIIELFEKDDNKTILRGVITEETKNRKGLYTYQGFDCGYYLNMNSAIIQYTGQDITNAIIRLCNEFNILVSSKILTITTEVHKIYNNQTLTNIIFDLLKIAKTKNPEYSDLYIDCSSGYLKISRYTENNNLRAYLSNIYSANSFDLITTYKIKNSIENLKNKILISKMNDSTSKMQKLDYVNDNESIFKYGLFQEILEVDNDNKQDYKKIADNKLKELNKATQTISLTFLGDYNAHKGVITSIDKKELGLKGKYLILDTKHTISGSKESIEANFRLLEN